MTCACNLCGLPHLRTCCRLEACRICSPSYSQGTHGHVSKCAQVSTSVHTHTHTHTHTQEGRIRLQWSDQAGLCNMLLPTVSIR